ncbi:MAG: hypothetical protein ACI86H_002297, partial [bacterium]
MKFALACEGITDQIALENILCGFFDDEYLDDEITYLQPPFDTTDAKQSGYGGWELLLDYLKTTRFRDDVVNNEVIILQIDTDISQEKNLDVSHYDSSNQELS